MSVLHLARRFRREPLYPLINIFSLSIGIWLMLLGILYWQNEHSYDQFHSGSLYRITTTTLERKGDLPRLNGGTGQVQGPAFRAEVPEVLNYSRLLGGGISGDVRGGEKTLNSHLLFADSSFFSLFHFPLISGNPATALNEINSVVITESVARNFFQSTDVVGRQLEMIADPSAKKLARPLVITGVAADIPGNSSIRFDLLLPMQFLQLSFQDQSWLNSYLSTFVLLRPGADRNSVAKQFNAVFASRAREQVSEHIRTYGFNPVMTYGLQPVSDIHLHPLQQSMESGTTGGSDPLYSRLFLGIGGFVLLMAAINFINISIAGSLKRAKEIGIRKTSGGTRGKILMAFLAESAVLCGLAFFAAAVFCLLSLPVFNRLTEKNIVPQDIFSGGFPFWGFLLFPLLVISAGLYPGWVLSGFSPQEAFSRKTKIGTGSGIGKPLVVLQFSVATFLIIASLVYFRQMQFIKSQGSGYNARGVLTTSIAGDREVSDVYSLVRNELARNPAVASTSLSEGQMIYSVKWAGGSLEAINKVIDENYLPLLQIPLLSGRNLSSSFPTDSVRSVLVNEAFVRAAGLTQPLGTRISTDERFGGEPRTIVGVIKDFHTGSFREPIRPLILFMNKDYPHDIFIRIKPGKDREAWQALASAMKLAQPGAVVNIKFLEESDASRYSAERRWQEIIGWATMLAIVICSLGLFGLARLAARQRTKEIGIRKTLGASVAQIAVVLSTGFVKLVLIAVLIALPAGALVMNQWLNGFAFRTPLGWPVLVFAALISVVIALLTVSLQTIRAGFADPVDCLRTE